MANALRTVRLQGVGYIQAKAAAEVEVGDTVVFNYGKAYEVIAKRVSDKTVFLTFRTPEGSTYARAKRPGTLLGFRPKKSAVISEAEVESLSMERLKDALQMAGSERESARVNRDAFLFEAAKANEKADLEARRYAVAVRLYEGLEKRIAAILAGGSR